MDLQDLETLASQEMSKHGLQEWTFGFSDAKRMLGVCKYRKKRIEIAEYYARNNSIESVLDTLLHEIAHALAGPRTGHGPAWKAIALRLGARPQACDRSPETAVQPGDWQATCPACKKTYHRYKRPVSMVGYTCRCPARSPLSFGFMGDPTIAPQAPKTIQEAANWEAECAGCKTVHLRLRKPKAGVWRCKCPARCEITWRFRSRKSTRS